jgi:hypothetical protein
MSVCIHAVEPLAAVSGLAEDEAAVPVTSLELLCARCRAHDGETLAVLVFQCSNHIRMTARHRLLLLYTNQHGLA